MRRRAIAAALTALAALIAPTDPADAGVSVRVGGAGQEDACATVVQVGGIVPRGFLAVRDGPGTRFRTLDRLGRGRSLFVCEERGPWLGVVYGERNADCAVSTPRRRRAAYAGSCRSGWVHRRYVGLLAG